jgi:predicted Fe-Mo cluster-binding NifX family protein
MQKLNEIRNRAEAIKANLNQIENLKGGNMKVAVSSTGPGLDSQVDPRFGRCQYFIIIDPDTMEFESIENPNVMASGGAGISTAQMIVSKGVKVVLTGNSGPNAYQVLSQAGIQIITGVTGLVRDAIQDFKAVKLKANPQPSVAAHSGMGMGMGRGMGRGMKKGMMGMVPPQVDPSQSPSKEEEIVMLKNQVNVMKQQLDEILRRMDELEKKD